MCVLEEDAQHRARGARIVCYQGYERCGHVEFPSAAFVSGPKVFAQTTVVVWCALFGCCTENYCAAFEFGVGVAPGSDNGCADGVSLGTRSITSCTVQCGAGYVGANATIRCPVDAEDNDAPEGSITCTGVCPALLCFNCRG